MLYLTSTIDAKRRLCGFKLQESNSLNLFKISQAKAKEREDDK